MTTEGHAPRSSERDSRIISEAARAPLVARSHQSSLTYYRPPASRRRQRAATRAIIHEAALAGPIAATPVAAGRLPDAAVGSFGNPVVLELVIGNDDRVRVKQADMNNSPFRQICALRIRAKNGQLFVGTGWFIGPRAVATAGHCVYLHKEGGWAASIEVIPAKFGSSEPLGDMTASRFRAVDGWIDQKRPDFDYGVILLDDSTAGDRLGWFEVLAEPDDHLKGALANISGYPADRDDANFQFFHARALSNATPTRIEYDIDTFGGQSGSPVWISTPSGVAAVGVHTTGAATGNSGTRITEPVIDNFLAWRDE
jgi:V8-like Glu-specific endopeptidase